MATDRVAWLVAVTFAFGIEAPVESTTTPAMAPCSTWARQTNALVAKSNDAISNALFRDILAPLRTANATRDCTITALYPSLSKDTCAIGAVPCQTGRGFYINRSKCE